jgi:ferric-dicitrate binding protein FerR (iron transport regulator)
MAKTKKAKSAVPYARRVLEDDYVQEQLRHAAAGLRVVNERVRRQRGQAAEDKRLYRSLQQAATSIREAILALQRPTPEPRRRRSGKIMVLAFAIVGTAWLTVKLQKDRSDTSSVPTASVTGVETAAGTGRGAPPPIPEPDQAATTTPPVA